MKTAILISGQIGDLMEFAKILDRFCKYIIVNDDQLNVVDNKNPPYDFLSFSKDEWIADLFDESEKNIIKKLLPQAMKGCFSAQFRKFETLQLFMTSLFAYSDFIIYGGDDGFFYKKDSFLKLKNYDEFMNPGTSQLEREWGAM